MTTIRTRLGAVRGIDRDGVSVFLGLPYAAPPTGGLRWRSPEPAPSWSATLDATRHPNRCPQPPYPEVLAGPEIPGEQSEDCLYLNVHTPAADRAGRPVICWIHGGGYLQGSANEYDGSVLAREQDCVVVTINYRLNVFGFCDVSALGDAYAGSVSRGFEDQIAALRWIRDNIADYGGDPGCVSIWGESGGAGSVLALQGAPAAEGLFHRSVAFSPGDIDIGILPVPDAAGALAAHLGIESDLEARLLALPAEELFALYLQGAAPTAQTVDGTVITQPVAEAIARKGAAGPPLIAGSNRDEGSYLADLGGPAPMGLDIVMALFLPLINPHSPEDYVSHFDGLLPGADEVARVAQVWCDLFRSASLRNAEAATNAGAGGWVYNFEVPTDHPLGITHGCDIAFTFNQFAMAKPGLVSFHESTDENRAIARLWGASLVQFARTGDPNGAGLPEWPRYDGASRSCLIFDDEPRVAADPDGDEVRRAYGLS